MKYFFEYPEKEVGVPPLFGESRFSLIDNYEQGVSQILEWVLIEDPSMGGVSIQGAVEELRQLLGRERVQRLPKPRLRARSGDDPRKRLSRVASDAELGEDDDVERRRRRAARRRASHAHRSSRSRESHDRGRQPSR